MSGSNKGPLRPAPLKGLADIMMEMPQEKIPSGARAPRSSTPVTPNLNWLVELFKEYNIPMIEVFKRLRREGYFPSVSKGKIIRQKLLLAWSLNRVNIKYTATELVDFVFNDKVYFPGQHVKLRMGPTKYYGYKYGTIGDVSWSQDGVFLEGRTISFKYCLPDGSFAYSSQSPEGIELWDGTYPKFNPSWANGGGAP